MSHEHFDARLAQFGAAVPFYDGLVRDYHNAIPRCDAQIDSAGLHTALNYANRGNIHWQMDGHAARVLRAPVIWWTVPGVWYRYGALPGETWEHRFISFSGPRADAYVVGGLLPADTVEPHFGSVAESAGLLALWDKLFALLDAVGPDGAAVSWRDARSVLALESLLLSAIHDTAEAVPEPAMAGAVRQWCGAIRAQPERDWPLSRQARQLGYSEGHLRRIFGAVTGVSPAKFVLQCRLEKAAALLRTTHLPVAQVALRAGFSDLPHFSRLFRQRYGTPPLRYRRETQLV